MPKGRATAAPTAEQLKARARAAIDAHAAALCETSDWIHAHPELGHQEAEASRRLAGLLEGRGAAVEFGTVGMATAFKAVLPGRGGRRPRVAVLAEYDALPEIGHACGHNLIGTAAIGAALGLLEVLPDLAGEVWVLGTPAEESAVPNAGGKAHMVQAGVFDEVDAAIMFHPASETASALDRSLAARGFEFFFHGRAAHAAGAPHEGVNALDAVVLFYNAVSMLRQQVRPDVRIHGIILSGGSAVNVIPDQAAIRYRARADDSEYLGDVVRRVVACAEGAAAATACRLEWHEYLPAYEDTLPNRVLVDLLSTNLRALGREVAPEPRLAERASTDFGNVTRRVPGAEMRIGITEHWGVPLHSLQFRDAAGGERGRQAMLDAARALAMTAVDLLTDAAALRRAREEFQANRGGLP